MSETFPRQKAATRNFQLGAPRGFAISADASLVAFLRSEHGRDPVTALWTYDVAEQVERRIADPRNLLADSDDIPAAERARRERMREQAAGITAFTTDDSGTVAAFALAGQLFFANLRSGTVNQLAATGPIIDPRISPDGQRIAWSTGPEVRVIEINGTGERVIADERVLGNGTPSDAVSWGLADFIASEELGRMHGMWWSPESDALLVERCDESPIKRIWLSDPTIPDREPREYRYPYAGTPNADVRLVWVTLDGHQRADVNLAADYLVSVRWQQGHEPLITTSDRAQQQFTIASLAGDGLHKVTTIHDSHFIDVIPGQPRWWDDALVTVVDDVDTDTRRIEVDGGALGPMGLQIMSVLGVTDDGIDAIATDNALDRFIAHIARDGSVTRLTHDGVASATPPVCVKGSTWRVVSSSRLVDGSRTWQLLRDEHVVHEFDCLAENPIIEPVVHYVRTGANAVNTAVLFPRDHQMGSKRLPVLMRPYGGPHGAQVLNSALIYLDDQWFADQGFAVIVADGRGTPGRGPVWDRSVRDDFATGVLADQVAALAAAAEHFPRDIDAQRAGIMGWSFGGYLSALAVMDRPDVFRAAIAGAPVTEWRWYDTAYTERYLGDPTQRPEVYDANSLLPRAAKLESALMLIHGLADDNVLSQHTLALSGELLAHGKAHTVLPLSGVSHMTPQEVVAENLMLLSAQFLLAHLNTD